MKRYEAKQVPQGGALPVGAFDPDQIPAPFDSLNTAVICEYNWGGAYRPEAHARVGYAEDGFSVLLSAREDTIASVETRIGGMVWKDSCLEFFFMPLPNEDARYLNIEVNSMGVPHIGLGDGRHGRKVWQELPEGMRIWAGGQQKGWWAVAYFIPASLIESIFGRMPGPGSVMRANFYSCDDLVHPHYGTWNPISADKPDFHRPECFGEILLKPSEEEA